MAAQCVPIGRVSNPLYSAQYEPHAVLRATTGGGGLFGMSAPMRTGCARGRVCPRVQVSRRRRRCLLSSCAALAREAMPRHRRLGETTQHGFRETQVRRLRAKQHKEVRLAADAAGNLPPRDQRDGPALRRGRAGAGRSHRRRRRAGPRPDGAGQPAAGRQHRPRLHGQGPEPAGPDRRRQPRPAAGGRGLRPGGRHALQHLRQLLDQAVDQAGPDQLRQDDPHPGLHGRAASASGGGPAPG